MMGSANALVPVFAYMRLANNNAQALKEYMPGLRELRCIGSRNKVATLQQRAGHCYTEITAEVVVTGSRKPHCIITGTCFLANDVTW